MDRAVIYRAGIMAILEEKTDDISMMESGRINHREQTYKDVEFLKEELKGLDNIIVNYKD